MSRIALVTGCSSGFGKDIVAGLLAEGWTVVATMRGADKRAALLAAETKAHPGRLHIRELDVTNAEGRRGTAAFVQTLGGLDLLVNNAGIGVMGALEDVSEDLLRRQFEVNFFGAALLTRELLPALRRSKGKVIMLSSILGRQAFPLGSAYCSSKFALEGLSEALAFELSPHGVQVCLVEPGGFRTKMADNTVWGEKYGDKSSPYALQNANLGLMREKMMSRPGASPEIVARRITALAGMNKMPRRAAVGTDAVGLIALTSVLPDGVISFLFTRLYDKLFLKPVKA
jgi:NAD(P)-dependent dehydrogenase (short-subunit alcohol dehydrogenase family)